MLNSKDVVPRVVVHMYSWVGWVRHRPIYMLTSDLTEVQRELDNNEFYFVWFCKEKAAKRIKHLELGGHDVTGLKSRM